jgi:hypothetical protein
MRAQRAHRKKFAGDGDTEGARRIARDDGPGHKVLSSAIMVLTHYVQKQKVTA